ncbi:MAG: TatD family hydrolase [Bacteroidota bacterium]|nr:TatD family hydrolase [Bacteroidota bacterium]
MPEKAFPLHALTGYRCYHTISEPLLVAMIFTDTHTHIYLEEFDTDRDLVIQRALDAGVRYFFFPNIDGTSVTPMLDLCKRFPENFFPMAGLHPTSVTENYREDLKKTVRMLEEDPSRYCAIGEVGIDLYWDKTFQAEQEEVFLFQMELALKYDLPLVIHTRNAIDIALDMIATRKDPRLKGVFHCFGGNLSQAQKAIGLGFYIGVGGIITFKNSGLQKIVQSISMENILLETDSPYLAPVPHRGERNESSYIPIIAEKISEIKQETLETVARITTENAMKLFKKGE